ncbi:multidrug resistance efflux pump [Bradyrhizobium sp. LM2.7]
MTARPARPGNGRLGRHPLLSGISAILLLATVGLGYLYWDYTGHFESTDDAFIAARQFSIAPKISGYVRFVAVTDNQHVNAGDVIARIDDRDYRTALAQAQAQVAAMQASIQNIDAQIAVQQAQIGASQAQLSQAEAALVFAQQQATRYADLMKTGSGTIQDAQQYSSQLRQQQAARCERPGEPQGSAAPARVAEGTAGERGCEPRAGTGAARPGPAESILYHG